jgi:hypothetical protein
MPSLLSVFGRATLSSDVILGSVREARRSEIVVAAVFVSYRRDDSGHAAARLGERLNERFRLFMDIDSIQPGSDFAAVVREAVAKADVVLAVIGRAWLTSADETGARRIDKPRDWVALEIGTALDRGTHVIPVLVDGARMPTQDELPPSLAELATRQAISLTHESFAADCTRLIKTLDGLVRSSEPEVVDRWVDPDHRHHDAADTRADPRGAPARTDEPVTAPTPVPGTAPELESSEPPLPSAAPSGTPLTTPRAPSRNRSSWLIPAVAAGALALVLVMSLVLLDVIRGGASHDGTRVSAGLSASAPAVGAGSASVASSPSATSGAVTADPGPVADLGPGLFCRDLFAGGFSYAAAVDYWRLHGEPNQMDADRNGIPCETVYSASDVAAYWGDRLPAGGPVVAPAPGLFCRDLFAAGYSYGAAVEYWYDEGQPPRMDQDLNGIPCETVYPSSVVTDYWSQ